MKKRITKNTVEVSPKYFVFGKKNYIFMFVGLALIVLGFLLMTGADANTVDGVYNPNKWNENIFSFRRVRLAPFFIVVGFIVEVYAIMVNPEKKEEN